MKKPKQIRAQSTCIPPGYTGSPKGFNVWQRALQRNIDKVLGTDVASKYLVN